MSVAGLWPRPDLPTVGMEVDRRAAGVLDAQIAHAFGRGVHHQIGTLWCSAHPPRSRRHCPSAAGSPSGVQPKRSTVHRPAGNCQSSRPSGCRYSTGPPRRRLTHRRRRPPDTPPPAPRTASERPLPPSAKFADLNSHHLMPGRSTGTSPWRSSWNSANCRSGAWARQSTGGNTGPSSRQIPRVCSRRRPSSSASPDGTSCHRPRPAAAFRRPGLGLAGDQGAGRGDRLGEGQVQQGRGFAASRVCRSPICFRIAVHRMHRRPVLLVAIAACTLLALTSRGIGGRGAVSLNATTATS